MVSQQVVHKLLARDELLSPQQHLKMYDSPLDISMDFGKTLAESLNIPFRN